MSGEWDGNSGPLRASVPGGPPSVVRGPGPKADRPCECPPDRCAYDPARVRHLLRHRGILLDVAENPRAALHQLHHDAEDERPCEECAPGGGGRDGSAWEWTDMVDVLADLDRARAAGCKTVEEYARWLCPHAVVVDNVRDRD